MSAPATSSGSSDVLTIERAEQLKALGATGDVEQLAASTDTLTRLFDLAPAQTPAAEDAERDSSERVKPFPRPSTKTGR